jgi:hypothetical protein
MLARFGAALATRTLLGSAEDSVLVKKEIHFANDAFRADLDALPTRLTYASVQLHVWSLPAIACTCFHSTLYLRAASSLRSAARHARIMWCGANRGNAIQQQPPMLTWA